MAYMRELELVPQLWCTSTMDVFHKNFLNEINSDKFRRLIPNNTCICYDVKLKEIPNDEYPPAIKHVVNKEGDTNSQYTTTPVNYKWNSVQSFYPTGNRLKRTKCSFSLRPILKKYVTPTNTQMTPLVGLIKHATAAIAKARSKFSFLSLRDDERGQ